jgi:hypothetical protein
MSHLKVSTSTCFSVSPTSPVTALSQHASLRQHMRIQSSTEFLFHINHYKESRSCKTGQFLLIQSPKHVLQFKYFNRTITKNRVALSHLTLMISSTGSTDFSAILHILTSIHVYDHTYTVSQKSLY